MFPQLLEFFEGGSGREPFCTKKFPPGERLHPLFIDLFVVGVGFK